MSEQREASSEVFGRCFNYANNPASIAGVVITTVSGLSILTFMVMELAGELRNPYVGLFSYLLLPAVFVLGLVLIPLGMWRRRKRLLAAGISEEERALYPRLDFNDAQMRRLGTVVLLLTAVNAVIFGFSSVMVVEHMETAEFCGTSCHTPMEPEYVAYQDSPHSQVACVECHIGPGALWFIRSKINGAHQLWSVARNSYERPIATPVRNLRPARETCEECHWRGHDYGEKVRVIARFDSDEDNTASYSALLVKTGGGSIGQGRHGGAHWWHVEGDNRIRYLAADERREAISWVELTTPSGEVRIYTREGEGLPPAEELAARARVMDCVDCHSRPAHRLEIPSRALDAALAASSELAALPFFKRQALSAVEEDHPTRTDGVAAVREALLSFYRESYPEIWSGRRQVVESAAETAARIYGRSVFPEMETTWETHLDHLGHEDFPGCFRCHDEELTTADGEHVISIDCESCHTFLVEDADTPPDLAALAGR